MARAKPAQAPAVEAAQPLPPASELRTLSRKVREALDLTERAAQMEADLKAVKSALHIMRTQTLPTMFLDLKLGDGLSNFEGYRLELDDLVQGGLPKEEPRRGVAIKWLEENEGAELLQTKVEMTFPRAHHAEAVSIARRLEKAGFTPTVKADVHAQTLHAWIRERRRNGENIDDQALGLFVGVQVKIKPVGAGKRKKQEAET